jgi:putative transposase
MKLTIQIQLLPDKSQAVQMRQTVERFNDACNWLAQQAFTHKVTNNILLQKLYYFDLRAQFGLSAQMASICVRHVASAYKRDKTIKPKFRKHAAMPYDRRLLSFKGIDRVSLKTLSGRIIVPMIMGRYQKERFSATQGQCDLVLRKDGKWFLLATVDLPEAAIVPVTDFLGVDLGTVQLASDSDGQHFDGSQVEARRLHYQNKRGQLQRASAKQKREGKRPLNIRRKLKKLSGRERRFKKDTNHCISKEIVEKAKGSLRGVALEELSGIRKTKFRKRQRDRISKWSFAELRGFIEYKARLAGVDVEIIDPAYTSQRCSECGHTERGNRRSRGIFWCKRCGHFAQADENAALNISWKAAVNRLKVSERKVSLDTVKVQRQAASL